MLSQICFSSPMSEALVVSYADFWMLPLLYNPLLPLLHLLEADRISTLSTVTVVVLEMAVHFIAS